jgi:hypothetical protein
MSASIRCWLQSPMTRIFPDSRPHGGGGRPFLPCAARGEVECFQVGIRTDGISPNYMSARPSDLQTAGGASIPAATVDVLVPNSPRARTSTPGFRLEGSPHGAGSGPRPNPASGRGARCFWGQKGIMD